MPANQNTRLTINPAMTDQTIAGAINTLKAAADTFVKNVNGEVQIWAASRDWFLEEWGRDTFIALPGLLLTTKRYDEAKAIFSRFAALERNGLVPNRMNEHEVIYNTGDASLLFIAALEQYVKATEDWGYAATLLPTIESIIEGYKNGTSYERFGREQKIYMDDDSLIVTPAQASWMDADPKGDGTTIVTPRNGKCVEINVLWYRALMFLRRLREHSPHQATDDNLQDLICAVRNSFANKFWNEERSCLFDVVDSDKSGSDVRPNQIFAVSKDLDLLSSDRQERVFITVTEALLTPSGLRTLASDNPNYKATYNTHAPDTEKDWAYHQGTVWPWLIGPYVDSMASLHRGTEEELRAKVVDTLQPLMDFAVKSEYGSLPEVYSAEPPHEPGGTTSQAWSVAEVLRVAEKYFS